jgi:superfamily II DNA or RNA helicase
MDSAFQRHQTAGGKFITRSRYSFDQIRSMPERCQDQLRRMLVADADLHPNFRSTLEPSNLQLEVLEALEQSRIEGKNRGLVCLPTGTGKTILSALDAKRVGGRVLFIVHNNHILSQAEAAYKRVFGEVTTGIINSEAEKKGKDEQIIFANIASLRTPESLKKFKPDTFDYLVLDEFHHGAAQSYQCLIKHFKPKFTLGLTATPERTDGKSILCLLDNNAIYSISLSSAIERGFLVPFSYYGMLDNVDYSCIRHNGYRYNIDDLERALFIPKRNDAILKSFRELVEDKSAIAFCVSIDHAENMANLFNASGIKSIAIHSKLSRQDRASRIARYEAGEVQVVFVRDLFNEGVDFPHTQAVLFLRPTESKIIFLQQLGRGLRLSPQKTNIIVLDFIGNYFGSNEVPSLIKGIAGEKYIERRPSKPKYTYDNGCEVIFSKDVIEHLQFSDYELIDKSQVINKIVSFHQKLGRPLTPLDLYLSFREDFGRWIRAFGDYKNLTERINSIDPDEIVLDSYFDGFDPSSALGSDDSGDFILQKSFELMDNLKTTFSVLEKNSIDIIYTCDRIHRSISALLKCIAPLCLIENTIKSYANSDISLQAYKITAKTAKKNVGMFFTRVAKISVLKNSYGISNALKVQYPIIKSLYEETKTHSEPQAYFNFAAVFMSQDVLSWIKDIHALCDANNLND